MNKKYTYEEVQYFFLNKNLKLLSEVYFNNLQKLKYKCLKCGHEGLKQLSSLNSGSGCPSCAGNLTYAYEQVKDLFLNKNLKLLSTEYKNTRQKLEYQCLKCGRKGTKSLKHLSNTFGCKKCGAEKGQNKKRHTYEQIKQLFLNKNLKLLSTGYKNCQQKLKYECLKCGYVGTKRLVHLDHSCDWYKMELTEEDRINRRNIPEYRKWAKDVKKKDDYTCQKCKQRGKGIIHSHHKNGWNNFPKQRYLITNGITLCNKCHVAFHSKYGKGNNIESQTYLFLDTKQ